MVWDTQPDPINMINHSGELDVSLAEVIATDSTFGRTLADRFAEVYNVKDFHALGDGVTDDTDEIEATLDAAEATGGIVYFPRGTYNYATSPNFARAGVSIVCDRDAILNHTGTGNAFILDGGAAGSGILNNRYENIVVQGNSNSTNGFYVRSIHHSTFIHPRVKGASTTGSAFLLEWCVLNTWINPSVSPNSGTLSPIPLHGMYITRRGSGSDHSSTQVLITPIFEGLTNSGGYGLYIDYAYGITVFRGTSESNDNGLYISPNGSGLNVFEGIDFESNVTKDVVIAGSAGGNYNTFIGFYGTGETHLTSNSNRNVFVGGTIGTLTVDTTASLNTFQSVVFTVARADSSTIGSNYITCTDPAGAKIYNKFPESVVATGDLPAASAAMNGTILIEDAGAGNRNLIIYGGGQRFRIDGGANF